MDFSFGYEAEKPPEKPRPLQSKAFLTKDPLARAEQDTVAAWRNWDLRVFGTAAWPESDERLQLLTELGEKAGDDRRLQALVRLRSLTSGASGARLWADEELRRALLACAGATAQSERMAQLEEPQELRCMALGVLLQAMRVVENRAAFLRDAAARSVLMLAMKRTHGEDVNGRGALLYVGLLIEAVRTESIQDYEDFLRVFKGQVDPELPPENREVLYGAMWSAATSQTADVRRLWKSDWVKAVLLEAAGPAEESTEVRVSALGALWALSGEDESDKEAVWASETARIAFVAGARMDQRVDLRRTSMSALASFAEVPSLRERVWQEVGRSTDEDDELLPGEEPPPPLADLLRKCAEEAQPIDIRLSALRALVELSWEEDIRKPMAWAGPPGVHTLLYRAVDDTSLEPKRRRYYRFAYDRVAPLAPEVLALAMVRDRLTRFLLPEHLWLPEPRWWEAMGIVKSELEAKRRRRHSWAGAVRRLSSTLGATKAMAGMAATDGWRGRRASVALGSLSTKEVDADIMASGRPATAAAADLAEAVSAAAGAGVGAAGDVEEAPEDTGQDGGGAPEGSASEEVPEALPDPEVPEYIDLGNVARCIGARVMQPNAPDRRLGSIVRVEHGTLEVTVQWWDTTFEELEDGELCYADAAKQGDPTEVVVPSGLEGLEVRSQHGRTGVITSAFRRPREAGERHVPLTVRIRWDPHVFEAAELGPEGALAFVRSQDLRLTSRSVMTCVVPCPPRPPTPPPTPPTPPEDATEMPPPERMRGRCEFEEEEDYIRYVREQFKGHGGPVGARVQFVDDVPFWSARKGLYGVIREFTSMDAFKVKWENGELLWTDMGRCQLQETSDKAFIWTEELPEPDFAGGGGISGPSNADIVSFEGAPVPVLRPWALGVKQEPEHAAFTLFVQMRTNVQRLQHFLEWGSEDGTRRCQVLRLTDDGNLEYGEHIGSMSAGWRSAQLTPKLKLCDGKWHSIAVVRRDTGFLWMYVDDELAGQGLIGANFPPGLSPSPRSYRWVKKDFVFHGDLGPLHVYSHELTINQIRAVKLLGGTPRLGT